MANIKNDRPLTLDRLKEVLSYDPNTGVFIWQKFLGPMGPVGSTAGSIRNRGYRIIRIDGGQYKASRLAWFYVHGEWPAKYLDHANGVKDDDRLSNLREATAADNACNTRTKNRTSVKGVYRARSGNYYGLIMRNGRQIYLGMHKTLEGASAARKAAAVDLHGIFASELR